MSDIKNIVKNLHPLEIQILLAYKKGDELTIEKVERELKFKPGNGNQALSWLAGKGLVSEIRREKAVYYEITALGQEWKEKGSPEERIIELIKSTEDSPRLPDIAKLLKMENKDIGSAFGNLSKLGVLAMNSEKKVIFSVPLENLDDPAKNPADAHFALLRGLFKKINTSEGSLLANTLLNEDEKKNHIRSCKKARFR